MEVRQRVFADDAIPQIPRHPRIARPQRIAALPVFIGVAIALRDRVHGERPGAIEPSRLAGALEELEEGVTVARGAVAQARAFVEWTRRPGQSAGCRQ